MACAFSFTPQALDDVVHMCEVGLKIKVASTPMPEDTIVSKLDAAEQASHYTCANLQYFARVHSLTESNKQRCPHHILTMICLTSSHLARSDLQIIDDGVGADCGTARALHAARPGQSPSNPSPSSTDGSGSSSSSNSSSSEGSGYVLPPRPPPPPRARFQEGCVDEVSMAWRVCCAHVSSGWHHAMWLFDSGCIPLHCVSSALADLGCLI